MKPRQLGAACCDGGKAVTSQFNTAENRRFLPQFSSILNHANNGKLGSIDGHRNLYQKN